VQVLENAHSTISASVVVRARGYDSTSVRYWQAGEPVQRTPAHTFSGDTIVEVPVLGLDTASTYFLETTVFLGDTIALATDTSQFATGSLPDWIPTLGTLGSDTTAGLLTISLPEGPVIIDNSGKVMWYRYFPNGALNSFQAHANGVYTVLGLNDTTNQFRVLNELGTQVGTLSCMGYETRFHDLLVLADGSAWIFCNKTRTVDLSALGGVDTARVTSTVLQHVSPDRQVLLEWDAYNHFAITDLPQSERLGPNVNFTHGNGIALDGDGNLLLSFRSLNELTKVDAVTGDVVWRFGGLANEFTMLNDPKGVFERQHGLRVSGPGQVQILDNGNAAPSRFVRYQVNGATRTALMTVQFIDDPGTYTSIGGATQYYPNGHAVVTFGRAGRVVELDEVGNRAWEVTGLDGAYVFRVQRIPSLYPQQWEAPLH
jgi:hypothetical protein